MEGHYFDYAATAPVAPQAARAAMEAMERWGNPSSGYKLGKDAARAVEECRGVLAGALGCAADEVVFTSGGTEGDNWALSYAKSRRGGHIVTTAVEHAAVLEPARALRQLGFDVTFLPVDKLGRVDPEEFRRALRDDTVLCSMMLVNNELGTVEPVAECARIAKAFDRDIFFHTDAVQAFLKVPFTVGTLRVDALTLSGHKLGAPKGIGAMYLKKGTRLKPLILGGGQERGLRSGTESTVLIAALAAAVREGKANMDERLAHIARVRDYAVEKLTASIPDLKVVSGPDGAPHILAVTLPRYKSETVVRFLSDRGVYLSSGSACHKGKPSHVYAALGLPKPWLDGMLRLSFGHQTTLQDVDALTDALRAAHEGLFTTMS